jgi:class 3 adenylate cyclase
VALRAGVNGGSGRRLLRVSVCPSCGHRNQPGAKFCSECGTALAAARPASYEERKVVTVLFADLVGFTSRAEQLDPEDVRALLSPFYGRLRAELERFGGTVEKFIGDAVMALFGAPAGHEDDPERAVLAALAIRDWVRGEERIQVRLAVNTGEALVVLGARPSEGEGMAAGDVVNTAARLQAAAPVNGILVGERTFRETREVIEYRQAQAVSAKGKREPVAAWEVVRARAQPEAGVPGQAGTALVGRERELGVLRKALARVRAERSPQLVTVVGLPGIGKSRLLYELKHLAAAGWIESLGRPVDQAEMLAHHYLSALDLARAANRDPADLAPRARSALHGAGDRALALNAFAVAAGFYRAALGLWSQDAGVQRADLLFRLAVALGGAGEDDDGAAMEQARSALLAAGDRAGAAEAEARLGALARLRAAQELARTGRRAEADDQLRPALHFFRSVGATRFIREGEALLAASA